MKPYHKVPTALLVALSSLINANSDAPSSLNPLPSTSIQVVGPPTYCLGLSQSSSGRFPILSRDPSFQETIKSPGWKQIRFLKRTMVEKNGIGINALEIRFKPLPTTSIKVVGPPTYFHLVKTPQKNKMFPVVTNSF